jgi:glycerol-3-phosphate O-acyltransferase
LVSCNVFYIFIALIRKFKIYTKMKKELKIANTETVTPITETVTPGKTPGRPVKENSKRQKKMLEQEIKRQTGGLKKGRPANPNSTRQMREAEKAQKRANGLLKPGRPAYTEEKRAEANALKDARKAEEKARIALIAAEKIKNGNLNIEEPVIA